MIFWVARSEDEVRKEKTLQFLIWAAIWRLSQNIKNPQKLWSFCSVYVGHPSKWHHLKSQLWNMKANLWLLAETAGTVTSTSLPSEPLCFSHFLLALLHQLLQDGLEAGRIGWDPFHILSLLRVTLWSDNVLLAKGRAVQCKAFLSMLHVPVPHPCTLSQHG